jgi:hypothetical protein
VINQYIEDREDHDKARSDIARAVEGMIDQAAQGEDALGDETKLLVRTIIYEKSVN